MFIVDHKELTLSFNEFHEVSDKDMPQYGEFCLLELKTVTTLREAGARRGTDTAQQANSSEGLPTQLIRRRSQDGTL